MDHRLIVNPATAERLEQLGWAENRDFLVSEPLPSDFPFPLCEWCRRAPATHLAVYDYKPVAKAATRFKPFLCTGCAHEVHVLPPGFETWWLFRLTPDDPFGEGDCEAARLDHYTETGAITP